MHNATRKSSPLLALAAGAAVCVSFGEAHALFGNVSASNGQSTFTAKVYGIKIFGSRAAFDLVTGPGGGYISGLVNDLNPCFESTSVSKAMVHFNAGVQVSNLTGFYPYGYFKDSQTDNYIAMRFTDGGTRYGWVHCVSTNADSTVVKLDTWSFNDTGGGILTLDESITPKKLPLSDGRVKLHWSNANEDGVARYEVQAQGADGAWAAVDADTPGAGSYAATVAGGAQYRLRVESVDGTAREVEF